MAQFNYKLRIGLRHIYQRVYNNDVFGESNAWSNNELNSLIILVEYFLKDFCQRFHSRIIHIE